MKRAAEQLAAALLAALISLTTVENLRAADAPDAPPLSPQAWAAEAQQRFQPITADVLTGSRQTVLAKLAALDTVLDGIPDGGVVRRQTTLDRLQEQLQSGQGDPEALRDVYRRLARSMPKECQKPVDDLRHSLLGHLGKLHWFMIADQRKDFSTAVDQVRAGLEAKQFDRAAWEALNASFGRLAETGLMDDLLNQVRLHRSHRNQFIVVQRAFVEAMLSRNFSSTMKINQSKGGATIRGQANFTADPDVRLIPNVNNGEFLVLVNGHGRIPLTATKSPATLQALGRATFKGEQTLFVTPEGVEVGDQEICVHNRTSLQGVCLHFRSRLLKAALTPIVEKVVEKKLPEGDRQIEAKAKAEISKQLTENSFVLMNHVNGLLNHVLWQTIDARDVDPQIEPSTTADEFRWLSHVITPTALGAPSPPPDYDVMTPPIQVQMHESGPNNSIIVMAGRRFNEVLFHEIVFGNLKLKPDDDVRTHGGRIPAAFTFATEDPVRFQFDDGVVHIRMRITSFELEGRTYNGLQRTVTVAYRPKLDEKRIALERDGEIRIEPAGAEHEALCRQSLERFLVRRASTGRTMPTKIAGLNIYLSHLTVRDGWMQLGLTAQKETP